MLFDGHGDLIKERRQEMKIRALGAPTFLENGYFLVRQIPETAGPVDRNQVFINLCDSHFKKVRDMGSYRLLEPLAADKVSAFPKIVILGISKSRIYVGGADSGYEISVYDLVVRLTNCLALERSIKTRHRGGV